LLGASEVIIGDNADSEVLARAMDGVRAVYHVGPTAHPKEAAVGVAMIDAAVKAGVEHFVYASVLHARISALVQHREKQIVEEHLVSAPLPFTILQPADFMETLNYKQAFRTGIFELIWGLDRAQALVSVEDLAEVGAMVLAEGRPHYGATYELSAPGQFTAHQIAALIARLAKKEVHASRLDVESVLHLYAHDEYGDEGVEYRRQFFSALVAWYSTHDFVGSPRVLTMLLGRPPTTLEEFLTSYWEHQSERSL
jgi:uncharacterized protein YbjT (DUF2867 family)